MLGFPSIISSINNKHSVLGFPSIISSINNKHFSCHLSQENMECIKETHVSNSYKKNLKGAVGQPIRFVDNLDPDLGNCFCCDTFHHHYPQYFSLSSTVPAATLITTIHSTCCFLHLAEHKSSDLTW